MFARCLVLAVALSLGLTAAAIAAPLRIGVLQFGTVAWELDVIRHHGLDRAHGVTIEVVPFAGTQATKVALQGGAVDVIVSDLFWVSRQRAAGSDFTFAPYSTALGALVVPTDSPVHGLADLAGRRLGIAGGPLDKSWLILRALARERAGLDLDSTVDKIFGAPPLLSEQLKAGRLDAVVTFWPYAARLEAAGFRRLMGIDEAVRALGIGSRIPFIGYVFRQTLADTRKAGIEGFLAATRAARDMLDASDAEWRRLAPRLRAPDATTRDTLRDGFRAGIPRAWGEAERIDARRLYRILAAIGGRRLVGEAAELAPGTFWSGDRY